MMKLMALFLLACSGLLAEESPIETFRNCSIIARRTFSDGRIVKYYKCATGTVKIAGTWSDHPGAIKDGGSDYRTELGKYQGSYNALDFGEVPTHLSGNFSECVAGFKEQDGSMGYGSSNQEGYLSIHVLFTCAGKRVDLLGKFGEEYQGHWKYSMELGEATGTPQWVNDPLKNIWFCSFQKWCATPYGFRLCGWYGEPKVDHGTPPLYKQWGQR